MDSELTRQLIRLRLQDGRLPRDRAVELGFGPGSGQACDGCGAAITAHQTMTLRLETADWAGENRRAVDVADQRLNGLDLRVSEAGARASSAETRADLATGAARDVEARLSQRLASRYRYRLLDTKFVYFDSGQTEIRGQDVNEP